MHFKIFVSVEPDIALCYTDNNKTYPRARFTSGWVGGAVSGAIQGGTVALFGAEGFFRVMSDRSATILGGGFGSGVGTFTTEILNNALDRTPEQQVSAKEIIASATASAITGVAVSTLTAGFNAQVDDGNDLVASRISTPRGDKVVFSDPFNPMEKELLKAFLGGANDCMGGNLPPC